MIGERPPMVPVDERDAFETLIVWFRGVRTGDVRLRCTICGSVSRPNPDQAEFMVGHLVAEHDWDPGDPRLREIR